MSRSIDLIRILLTKMNFKTESYSRFSKSWNSTLIKNISRKGKTKYLYSIKILNERIKILLILMNYYVH